MMKKKGVLYVFIMLISSFGLSAGVGSDGSGHYSNQADIPFFSSDFIRDSDCGCYDIYIRRIFRRRTQCPGCIRRNLRRGAGNGGCVGRGRNRSAYRSKDTITSDKCRKSEKRQLLAGDTLAKGLQQKEAARKERLAVTERTREEIRQVEEEKKRQAEKEAARQAAVVYYSDQDYEVLTRIVEAEAGGCDTKGRILVANVVLNRVKSKEFPNTITDVVYQKSQFSPVFDGRLRTCRVSEKTVEAVNRALEGEDYSQGALYFMNWKIPGPEM